MIYINNYGLPCTRRSKGKQHKSIYKNKVLTILELTTMVYLAQSTTEATKQTKDYKWTPIQRSGCFHQS